MPNCKNLDRNTLRPEGGSTSIAARHERRWKEEADEPEALIFRLLEGNVAAGFQPRYRVLHIAPGNRANRNQDAELDSRVRRIQGSASRDRDRMPRYQHSASNKNRHQTKKIER